MAKRCTDCDCLEDASKNNWDLYTILDKPPRGAGEMRRIIGNTIAYFLKPTGRAQSARITIEPILESIEDLRKRVKHLEECGGPGVH